MKGAHKSLLRVLFAAIVLSLTCARPQAQEPQVPVVVRLEDFQRSIGPLLVKDQRFTIVLHCKRLRGPGVRASGSEETVASMEIRNQAGLVVYQRSFPVGIDQDHFFETTEVSARRLEGKGGSGLLVVYGVEPSTPLGGGSYQVFGLFDGKLVPFSAPISLEGDLMEPEPASETVAKTGTEPGLDGETLHFRVWTSNFFAIIPVRVDWLQAKARLGWRCMQMTSKGWQPICRFEVEAQRIPAQELTFVRLLPEPFEPESSAQHVVVKQTSKVEILEGAGIVEWNEDGDVVHLNVGEDLWLKIRIDGKEGWIHTQEDFSAIGLPQAG
ncbi:MAG: hypothetical protein HYX72_03275 [Acidobacteria bacterium]|nr:hypothetical protein [Acidobacteriota bacterium]